MFQVNIRRRVRHRKHRVVKTVVLLVFSFLVLWTPINFLSTILYLYPSLLYNGIFFRLKLLAHTMSYASATINPLIYGWDRKMVRSMLGKRASPFFLSQKQVDRENEVRRSRRFSNLNQLLNSEIKQTLSRSDQVTRF